ARCFGEVSVHGPLDIPLAIPVPLGVNTVGEAAAVLGAQRTDTALSGRRVLIGPASEDIGTWSVQAYWNGWNAGIGPAQERVRIGRGDCVLAGIAAGVLP